MFRASLILVCCAIAFGSAPAQICGGSAPFSVGPVRLAGGASFTDGARSFGGQLAAGSTQASPFAAISVASVQYDDVDETGMLYGVSGGWRVPLTKVEVCPVVGFLQQSGPNFQTSFGQLDLSGRTFSFGLSMGTTVTSTTAMQFVPFGAASFVSSKATATLGGTSESNNDQWVDLSAGGGFILSRTLTVQPSVSYAAGLENADPVFSIFFGFNFGAADSSGQHRRK